MGSWIPNRFQTSHVDFGVFRKAMMKTVKFPVTVSEEGVSATIRKFSRIKNGKSVKNVEQLAPA